MTTPDPVLHPSALQRALVRFFGHGGGVAFYLIGAMLLVTAASTALFAHTASLACSGTSAARSWRTTRTSWRV